MDERPVEEIVAELARGEGDPASVPLSRAAEIAEGLADAGAVGPLVELAVRVLPRLLKKEDFVEIEGIWLACCAASAIEPELMLRTLDRMAARGRAEQAAELAVMLIDALVSAGRGEEAVGAAAEVLRTVPAASVLAAAAPALAAMHPAAKNLPEVISAVKAARDPTPEALRAAERALRFSPGTFVLFRDHTVARVRATDGVQATVQHPSGTEEVRRLDGEPPPRALGPEAHEVRRLFDPEALRQAWLSEPVACLSALLAEHGGSLTAVGLAGVLCPHVVDEARFDEVLAALRAGCAADQPDLPSYDQKRRLFVAAGASAPVQKRRARVEGAAPRAPRQAPKAAASRAPARSEPAGPTEQPRWVDLTALPAIRALFSRIEGEIGELTHELNVELPVRLEEARAHGDLRENAEYDAAKDRLKLVQARIGQLHQRLGQLHELSHLRLIPGRVTVMSRVTVAAEETGEERTFRITPAELPEPSPGDVSAGTPYAKALIGREVGELAMVRLPRRTERLEIVKVEDPG